MSHKGFINIKSLLRVHGFQCLGSSDFRNHGPFRFRVLVHDVTPEPCGKRHISLQRKILGNSGQKKIPIRNIINQIQVADEIVVAFMMIAQGKSSLADLPQQTGSRQVKLGVFAQARIEILHRPFRLSQHVMPFPYEAMGLCLPCLRQRMFKSFASRLDRFQVGLGGLVDSSQGQPGRSHQRTLRKLIDYPQKESFSLPPIPHGPRCQAAPEQCLGRSIIEMPFIQSFQIGHQDVGTDLGKA